MFDTNELNKTRAFRQTLHLSLNLFCGASLLTWIQIELQGQQ